MDTILCMMDEKTLSKSYWAEVANTTIYLMNQSPTTQLNNIIPEKAFTSKKPMVNHFRVFGSATYAHVLDATRGKLM